MEIVVTIITATAVIAGALWGIFHWTRTRKSWCVILYHVSRDSNVGFQWPNSSGGPTNDTLDEKLDQVVDEIESIPCGSLTTFLKTWVFGQQAAPGGVDWEDIHVIYRAVWNKDP